MELAVHLGFDLYELVCSSHLGAEVPESLGNVHFVVTFILPLFVTQSVRKKLYFSINAVFGAMLSQSSLQIK